MRCGCASLLGLLLVAVAGCGGGSGGVRETQIVRFPKWDYRPYERLAVPLIRHRDPRAAPAATQATYRLEQLLHENGAFALVTREQLADVLTEQDLAQLAGVADPATVIPPGRIQIAQALVLGEITVFDIRAERLEKLEPVVVARKYPRTRRNPDGGTTLGIRQAPRLYYRHSAKVGGALRVIDLTTSRLLLAYDVPPIEWEEEQRDRPPDISPAECAARAAEQMAAAFYHALAPIRVEVELKGRSLGVALDYYDGEYDEVDDVPADADELLVFVRELPRECEQNPFRLVITPSAGRAELLSKAFVWTANNPTRGVQFRVPVAELRGGSEFTVKLYGEAGERPLLTRDFRLVPPE